MGIGMRRSAGCYGAALMNRCSIGFKRRLHQPMNESGQMVVELAFVFPVLLVVALIAINALTFFSECAAFDGAFREGVRLYCTSPGYGQDGDTALGNLEAYLGAVCDEPNETIAVRMSGKSWGYREYIGELSFSPTIFSHTLKPVVFGISFPSLVHEVSFVVDSYKPGVVL